MYFIIFRAQWSSEDNIAAHRDPVSSKEIIKRELGPSTNSRELTSAASRDHLSKDSSHTGSKPVTTVAVYNRPQSQPPPSIKSSTNNNNINLMTRSQSHDVNINADYPNAILSKQSHSDGTLDCNPSVSNKNIGSLRQKPIKETVVVDEETYSTDSTSSTVDDEVKRRRRKLFPTFTKKNKEKTSSGDKSKNKND